MIPIGARLWRFALFYDTMEYKALGGSYDTDPKIVIPDEGQDYLAGTSRVSAAGGSPSEGIQRQRILFFFR